MAENTPKKGKAGGLAKERQDEKKYSAETEAIIDRLKAEGKLTRNGKNSLRTVSVELGKFSEAFKSISASIGEQTGSLNGMAVAAARQAEIQKTEQDFKELDGEDNESDTAKEIKALKEATDLISAKNDLKEAQGPGLIGSLLGGSLFKNIALLAGGGFVAYNFAKGFIDKMTNGGFSRFQNTISDIDWSEIGDSVKAMGTTAMEFASTATAGLGSMIEFFDDPLKILLGLSGAVVGAKLLTSIGTSIAAKAIGHLVMGSPGAMSGAGGKGMGKAMMGALGAAGLIYAQDIAEFIVGEAKNSDVTKIDIKNAASTVGISVASGATIGAMFGPKGMLAGAILGGAYGLGLGLVDYVKENLVDMGKTSKEGKQAIQKLRARKDMVEAMGQEKFDAWAAGNEDMNEELLLQQASAAQEDIRAKLEEAKKKKDNVKTTELVSINRRTGERTYRARNQDSILRDLERADEEIQRYQDQLMTLDSALQTTGYDPTALIPKVEAIPFDQSGPEMAPGKIVETEAEMSPELKAYLDRNDISNPIAGMEARERQRGMLENSATNSITSVTVVNQGGNVNNSVSTTKGGDSVTVGQSIGGGFTFGNGDIYGLAN
jgi:hypothetical protein